MTYRVAFFPVMIAMAMLAPAAASERPSASAAQQVAQADGLTHSGTVTEVLHTAGYVYIQAEGKDGRTWIAAPTREVRTGSKVRWGAGAEMTNFQSKSLNRMFHQVVFVDRIEVSDR